MKIKKYTGNSAHEAMINLKRELGPDAVILNTKTVRAKGVFGMFKKPVVEITAAYEEVPTPTPVPLRKKEEEDRYSKELVDINQELMELRKLLKLNVEQQDLKALKDEETSVYPEMMERLKSILMKNGVYEEIIQDIFKDMMDKIDVQTKSDEEIYGIVKYHLIEKLGNPTPITLEEKQEKIFFIGPTGVGKTTTLAKVAASLVMENKYKIGFITSDTYRIGAVDQLKIYSDILNVPLKVSYNKKDMDNAILDFGDKDLLLIDTAGRNHNDEDQIMELKTVIESAENKSVYLLINSTIDRKVLKRIIEKYNFVDDYKIIVTKVDESEDLGSLLNIRYLTDKELSYYTNGQSVPDDIKIIKSEEIVENLLSERGN